MKRRQFLTGALTTAATLSVTSGRAFGANDDKTWTDPVVIARNKKGWLAYPYLFEASPGELWITTMQGGLQARFHEKDFVGK